MDSLKDLRKAAGLTQQQLADLVGTQQPQIRKLEAGERKLSKEWAERLAPHLKVDPKDLLFSDSLPMGPIVGYVGAGMEIHGERDSNPEYVSVPVGARGPVEVVVVRGDSMWPVYRDGDRLIFEATSLPLEALIGKECVVQLEDGRKLVKTIRLLRHEYVLESFNAPMITDVVIAAAWPVKWIERR